MVLRLLAAARAMRSRTCADVIQPCWHARRARVIFLCDSKPLEVAVVGVLLTVMIRITHSRILVPHSIQCHYRI